MPPVNKLSPFFILATWFGSGLLPKAPGTWGSLAALPFAWAIQVSLGNTALIAATIAIFIIGVWASNVTAAKMESQDPGQIVIDEVCGQWMVLCVVPPDLFYYFLGFILFRFADIKKPWPVSWADQNIKGGLGIMVDDVLAGVYAGAVLYGLKTILERYLL